MAEGGSSVAAGWFVYNGELIKFTASSIAAKVKITETLVSVAFEDGLTKAVYKIKTAVCDATGDFDYADFFRMDKLKDVNALVSTLNTNLTALQTAYAAHTHSWASITGKPAGYITYVGSTTVGDVGDSSMPNDKKITVTIPNQGGTNYIIAGSLVGLQSDPNYDNDVVWIVANKQSGSFDLWLRDTTTTNVQNLAFDFAIIKTL